MARRNSMSVAQELTCNVGDNSVWFKVIAPDSDDEVYLEMNGEHGTFLAPAQARRLARLLLDAADA